MTSFAEHLDAFYNARRDYGCSLEAKGYRTEGEQTVWEPQDPVDVEPFPGLKLRASLQ